MGSPFKPPLWYMFEHVHQSGPSDQASIGGSEHESIKGRKGYAFREGMLRVTPPHFSQAHPLVYLFEIKGPSGCFLFVKKAMPQAAACFWNPKTLHVSNRLGGLEKRPQILANPHWASPCQFGLEDSFLSGSGSSKRFRGSWYDLSKKLTRTGSKSGDPTHPSGKGTFCGESVFSQLQEPQQTCSACFDLRSICWSLFGCRHA